MKTTHDIEQYLHAQATTNPAFGSSGNRLAFLLDTTGTPQVWTVQGEGEWPTQHTYFNERVSFVDPSPTNDELAFGMDKGSNEREQLFRYDITSGTITRLTASPEHKHEWGGWTSDGERFAFASNRRDNAAYDLYVQRRDGEPGSATCVYEGQERMSLFGWSPDDERLVARLEHASFDQDLIVIDVASGEGHQVTPEAGDHRYASPNWSPDGDALYLATNATGDTMSLARLNLKSGDMETIIEGGEWDIETAAFEPDSGRLAYSRNVDGRSELHIGTLSGDTCWTEELSPSLPTGKLAGFRPAGQLTIGPDGRKVAVAYERPDAPPTIYVVDIQDGTVSTWTTPSTAGIPASAFTVPETVRYETFDGRKIPALFSLPDNPVEGETPVIVDIHGGPESQRRPGFDPGRQYFLDAGYAVFEPNVRGSFGYGKTYAALDDVKNRMDSVKDVRAGVEWLHGHDAVDPNKIIAYGASYGGFMVLSSLTEYPELWAAGVDRVGIANFVTFLENTSDWRQGHREAEYGTLADDREFLAEISPLNNIDAIEAPIIVLHGENDPRVPVEESRQLAEAASEHVPVETCYFPDEGHMFTKLENQITTYREITSFLDEHV